MLKSVISALAVVLFAGPAVAQSVATGDGRMMEIPVAPAGCTVDNIGMGQKITNSHRRTMRNWSPSASCEISSPRAVARP